jgi:hypothetical protein
MWGCSNHEGNVIKAKPNSSGRNCNRVADSPEFATQTDTQTITLLHQMG